MGSQATRTVTLDVISPEGVLRYRKTGDTQDRLAVLIDGTLLVGDGTAAPAALPGTTDAVYTQAVVVTAPAAATAGSPAALTAVAAAGAAPTKAEFDALLADVTAMRTNQAAIVTDNAALLAKVAALLTALKGTGKPMAP